MRNYIVLGVSDRDTAIRLAVFGEVARGEAPNARYLSFNALCGIDDPLHSLLRGSRLRRALRRAPALLKRLERANAASLERHRARPRLDRLRRKLFAGETDFIFCPGTALGSAPLALLEALRRACPHSRMLFYLVDNLERTAFINGVSEAEVVEYLRRFDGVYSFDRPDVARYPALIRYLDVPLWRSREAAPEAPGAELYFCGRDKGRGELILAVGRRLKDAGLRFRARVVDPAPQLRDAGLAAGGWVPYERTVTEMLGANCILEIVAAHCNESTLRYKEAVVYNKKLLTNNAGIVDLPYYDARWMRVMRSAEDIDLDWLRAVEPVDYGYRGDFSLETFFARLEACEAERTREK